MPVPENDASLFDVMYTCRAMRRLSADPVDEELLVQLVDAAIQGPSGTNSQNWRFVIVRDDERKKRIADEWQTVSDFYDETIAKMPLREGETEDQRDRQRRASKFMTDHMHEVPAIIFVAVRPDDSIKKMAASPWTALAALRHFGVLGAARLLTGGEARDVHQADGAAYPAVQNMLLAARALGLGAVLTTPYVFVPGKFEEIIGLPADIKLCAMIPVGYPKGKFGPIRRPDPRSVICWDTYGD